MKFDLNPTSHDSWAVRWEDLSPLWSSTAKFKLMSTIFNEVQVKETAALGVMLNSGEIEHYWIYTWDYFQDKQERWEWYAERYVVKGVIFQHKDEAERFKKIMEQKVTWALLKESKA
jgi:hypothetical protein